MTSPGEHHSLTNVIHSPPILSVPFDARPLDGPADEPAIDLKSYLNTLYDSRWLIGGITLLVTVVALLYALVAKPVYEANLMIHVEEESPNAPGCSSSTHATPARWRWPKRSSCARRMWCTWRPRHWPTGTGASAC